MRTPHPNTFAGDFNMNHLIGSNPDEKCGDRKYLFYVQFIIKNTRRRLSFTIPANDKMEAINAGWIRAKTDFEWWMSTYPTRKHPKRKYTIEEIELNICKRVHTKK